MKTKLTVALFLSCTITTMAATYEVGPMKTYLKIGDVPTHDLYPGDTIKVFYKATPYFEKFLLAGAGTGAQPIVFIGIPDASGNKPIIDGENAITGSLYNFYNADRQIIKVGEDVPSDYIIIDGFILRNANNTKTFKNFAGGTQAYLQNACAIRPEICTNLTVRNCEIYNCGNGLMGGAAPQVFTIERCYIHDNGLSSNPNSNFQHNIYAG